MDDFAKDFVSVLQYLLLGFVSAWVFYPLTANPKPSQFRRVVQGMILQDLHGLILAHFTFNDKLIKPFSSMTFTSQNSYLPRWFKASLNVTYAVLHLNVELRFYSWPMETPSDRNAGCFF